MPGDRDLMRGCGGEHGSWRRARTVPGRRGRAKTISCTTVLCMTVLGATVAGMTVRGRRAGARVSPAAVSPAAVSGAGASAAQVNGRLLTWDSLSLCGSP